MTEFTRPDARADLQPELGTPRAFNHVGLTVPDIEAAAEAAVDLGATRIDSEPVTEVGAAWIRLEDPEGNIFCFVRERRP